MATVFADSQTLPTQPTRSRAKLVALWTFQVIVAGLFLMAGTSKLTGAPEMVAMFDAIGVGQWFRYVTGSIEVGSALMLLIPSLAAYGSLLLVATMTGAILTHLFIIGGSPAAAMVFNAAAATIAWARRDEFKRLF